MNVNILTARDDCRVHCRVGDGSADDANGLVIDYGNIQLGDIRVCRHGHMLMCHCFAGGYRIPRWIKLTPVGTPIRWVRAKRALQQANHGATP